MALTLHDLRRHAVARSLFPPTTLLAALRRLGFVQADPIRAPARAQDLTLRHRVQGYRAGDLERRYARLPVEEDFFVNYGFLPRELQRLMHPRRPRHPWDRQSRRRAPALLEFVRERGNVHPREVDAYFAHGRVTNYWGGASSATTHLLDAMQYRGQPAWCAEGDPYLRRPGLRPAAGDCRRAAGPRTPWWTRGRQVRALSSRRCARW